MTELIKEEWRDVVGLEGLYKVSNLGNILSLPAMVDTKLGVRPRSVRNGGRLNQKRLQCEYVVIRFHKGAKCIYKKLHRVVAIAFIPNPENKPEVNHINGIKTDNRLENLEWATRTENMKHASKLNLWKKRVHPGFGEKHHSSKLKDDQVREIRSSTLSTRELINKFGVAQQTISKIRRGERWKSVV